MSISEKLKLRTIKCSVDFVLYMDATLFMNSRSKVLILFRMVTGVIPLSFLLLMTASNSVSDTFALTVLLEDLILREKSASGESVSIRAINSRLFMPNPLAMSSMLTLFICDPYIKLIM